MMHGNLPEDFKNCFQSLDDAIYDRFKDLINQLQIMVSAKDAFEDEMKTVILKFEMVCILFNRL